MLDPIDRRHGTLNGYEYHRCRCDACRAANNRRNAVRRAKGSVPLKIHLARVHAKAQHIEHGTSWAYEGKGCRCDLCREARRERGVEQRYRRRLRDGRA